MATADPPKPDPPWSGGPLFRKPGTSRADFRASWLRHGQLVLPYFVRAGFSEYYQIHFPDSLDTEWPAGAAAPGSLVGDGIAVVRRGPPAEGQGSSSGPDARRPYYEQVILPDERRFLHDESGSRPVKRDPPAFTVPERDVLDWRDLALKAGAVEHRIIEGGKVLVDIPESVMQEWERIGSQVKSAEGSQE